MTDTPPRTPLNLDDINAALHLEGVTLPGGWVVGRRNPPKADGGLFSVSYPVVDQSGRRGFLKVLDLVGVFGDLQALGEAVNDYLAERDLVLMCGSASMTRVVVAVDHGEITLPHFFPLLSTVHYIIFEEADLGDLNDVLAHAETADVAVRLDLIHDYAVGLQQLHAQKIAHQDVKPANSLVFSATTGGRDRGKVGDLGQAFQASTPTSHDSLLIPGDRSFAPPELLYDFEYQDMATRRFAADLYQLGSLTCYAFGGVTMNGLLAQHLAPEHHWDSFGDGYLEVLPYLQEAYTASLLDLQQTLPRSVSSEITRMVEYLCEPEAHRRGHPRSRSGRGSRYALTRVVADLNLAAVRARSRDGLVA